MSERDGTQSSKKQRKSGRISSGKQAPATQRPANDDTEGWKAFWKERGQSWRTEPEIDKERQQDLEKRLANIPMEREKDTLFFDGFQLNRADIEWLLATQKKPDRIVYFYSDNEQRQRRESLTLCGANLHKVNLSGLPMERVNLLEANLEGANLRGAHLEGALLIRAHLEYADLTGVYLEGAYLGEAHLEGISIFKAHLGKAVLNGSHLERTNLYMTDLREANLVGAHLEGADLRFTHLEEARLMPAYLEGANLEYSHLEGANLTESYLEGAILCNAFFDRATALNNITLGNNKRQVFARLADLSWGDANLAVVDWSGITMLGDEHEARNYKEEIDQKKNQRRKAIKTERNLDIKKRLRDEDKLQSTTETEELIKKFQAAIRANRQLASALQTQGMNEDATKFAYNAQVLRRQMLLEQITAHQTQITLSILIVFVLLMIIFFLVNLTFLIDQLNCRSIYESSSACPNGTLSVLIPPPLGFIVFLLVGFMLLASIPIIYTRFIIRESQRHIPLWKLWLSLLPLLGGLVSLFVSLFVYLPSVISTIASYFLDQITYVPYFLKPLAWIFFFFLIVTFMLTFIPFNNRKFVKITLVVCLFFGCHNESCVKGRW